jgi:hypothetical protein
MAEYPHFSHAKLVILLTAAICVLPVACRRSSGPVATSQVAATSRITLRVVDQTNQQGIGDVSVLVQAWNNAALQKHPDSDSPPTSTLVTDDAGNAKAEIFHDVRNLRIEFRKEGWVPKAVQWSPGSPFSVSDLPNDCTIPTERGTTIGGVIQNEQGHPIAGVQVDAINATVSKPIRLPSGAFAPAPFPSGAYDIWQHTKTDSNGHWHLDTMPSKLGPHMLFELTCPGYTYPSLQNANRPPAPPEKMLRDQTAVMVMKASPANPAIQPTR